MSYRIRKLFIGVLNVFAWLVFAFAVGVSLVGFLSQAVRTSRRRSFKNNIDVLIIGIAYTVVVGVPSPVIVCIIGDDEKKKFVMSLAFCLKRRISVVRKLQRLSRGRVALHKGDVPKVGGKVGGECAGFYYSSSGRANSSAPPRSMCMNL